MVAPTISRVKKFGPTKGWDSPSVQHHVHTDRMLHPDVLQAHRLVNLLGQICSLPVPESDNTGYGAATSTCGTAMIRFRVGKVTAAKVGLFVAVWRRSAAGGTEPFPADHPEANDADTLVISVREAENSGHFVLPRSALVTHGISSLNGRGGKRGFRVYPPWSETANPQARKTQAWQSRYFHYSPDGGLPTR